MRCRYNNKRFVNEQNGYTVAVFTTDDCNVPLAARDKYLTSKKIIGFTAVGYGLPITDVIELEMEGRWEQNDHGLQFMVENFMEVVPRTREGIIGYLASGAVKGVGPKTAELIFMEFGTDTLEIMEKTPEKLLKIRGITEKRLVDIKEGIGKNKVFRELLTFLAPYNVSPKKVNLILQTYADEALDIIRHRPYMLCGVKGFGFLTTDEIVKKLRNAQLDSPMRISGCISHVLQEAMKKGHLYLERSQLLNEALEILNKNLISPVVTDEMVNQVLYRLVLQKNITLEAERIYITKQYQEELEAASLIVDKLFQKIEEVNIERELEQAQCDLGITLSQSQKQAVRMVFNNSLSIITGGPGTGKTTTLQVILYVQQKLFGTEVQLMAPTGRAARRMAESTNFQEASTIHTALGLIGDRADYDQEFELLTADFLSVDEVSMVDMHLAFEFLRHLKRDARVLFIGDANQLPSVEAGDVFRQLIACGLIPVTVLDLVYRQGEDSNIPFNAHLIQENKTSLRMGSDFQFMKCSGAQEAAEIVKKIYMDEIVASGADQVQILTPYRKRSAAGVEELNKALQDIVNPRISGKKELTIGSSVYREGDKVMQNKNTDTVCNGDMGYITNLYKDADGNCKITIQFTDNRILEYESEQMDMIEHANAITIHKAQGSECPVVIIPWVRAFYMMLKRNILYTAITRAKQKVYLVGEWNAVCQAIHTDDSGKRNSCLGARIVELYNKRQTNCSGVAAQQKVEQLKLVI